MSSIVHIVNLCEYSTQICGSDVRRMLASSTFAFGSVRSLSYRDLSEAYPIVSLFSLPACLLSIGTKFASLKYHSLCSPSFENRNLQNANSMVALYSGVTQLRCHSSNIGTTWISFLFWILGLFCRPPSLPGHGVRKWRLHKSNPFCWGFSPCHAWRCNRLLALFRLQQVCVKFRSVSTWQVGLPQISRHKWSICVVRNSYLRPALRNMCLRISRRQLHDRHGK
jgi:hypothetical protein